MSIKHTIDVDGEIIRVKAWGEDDNLQDVMNYNMAMLDAIVTSGATKVLSDERELEYKIGTFDLYDLAEKIAKYAPRLLKAAIVYKTDNYDDAIFWENATVNKGLQFRAFASMDEAEEWIRS
jgi:hypothetical protein